MNLLKFKLERNFYNFFFLDLYWISFFTAGKLARKMLWRNQNRFLFGTFSFTDKFLVKVENRKFNRYKGRLNNFCQILTIMDILLSLICICILTNWLVIWDFWIFSRKSLMTKLKYFNIHFPTTYQQQKYYIVINKQVINIFETKTKRSKWR